MKVLVINPGATSTKVAVFDEETQVYKTTVDHSPQELDRFDRVIDQADYRQQAILDAVAQSGFRLSDFDAVCGRGGLYRPIPSGTYAVNDRVMHDVETAPYGEHPSNLGAYLARRIGDMVGVPAFFVDPVCVDELTEVAHYTGFAPFRRLSQFHALNQKSIGRKAAAALGKPYEEADLIVCHLGGGVSVAAHHNGRIVDLFNVKDEGSMGMDRAGGLPVNQLINFCFSGRSQDEVKKILGRQAGMFSYLGTTDFRVICKHLSEIVTGHRNRILGIDLLRIDDILNRVQIVLVLQHDLVNLKNRRIRLANFFYRLFIQLAELADGLLNCRIKPRFFLLCILYFRPFYGLLAFLIHTYFSNRDTAKYTFSTIRLHDHSPFH